MRFRDVYKNNLFMLKFVWKYYKIYIITSILISFSSILTPLADVLGPKYIIDFISQKKPFTWIVTVVILIFSIEILKSIYYSWYYKFITPRAHNKIKGGINNLLMQKAASLDLECYENADFYDKYTRALKEADIRALSVVSSTRDFLLSLVYALTLFGVIVTLDPILLLISVVSMLLSSLFGLISGKCQFKYERLLTPFEKHLNYIKRVFYEVQYSKEIRIFPISKLLFKKYDNNIDKIDSVLKTRGKKLTLLNILGDTVEFIMTIGVTMLYLAWKIYNGVLTLGDFMALYIASRQFSSRLQVFFNSFTQFYEHSLYITNLKEVLDYESKIENSSNSLEILEEKITDISVDNVSFSYSEREVLHNITIKASKGEKIAIVGHNGAGKTTLIKLIIRLYDVNKGEILINNKDIKKLSVKHLRSKIGLVFQDYQLYSASIAENVLLREVKTPEDEDKVWFALKQVGLYEKVKELPNGIHTLITKEFSNEGIFLSGGEAQKLALARIYIKDYDIVILDEPSSSLDPLAEKQMYENMMDITKNKIAIFITHRLSTTVMADRIYLIDNGRVIEQGTHKELMELNGKYRRMFDAQAQFYREQAEDGLAVL
ncbi:ABC transporter ATP-binding protein [Caloranaerobacter azorensis]|uniref:ABC transporter ATP-binding protein n=1 Tax=Caloranaerobacter azorensis TaxID=116090 RepID=A0A6P1YEH3_9FIRM|nr:ABC transporter ATP-binding protein [Caloranaerobacter azorensis]QIB27487.1 ABC transporter ATP-binding protein [Caloranaerobacter azorensis]